MSNSLKHSIVSRVVTRTARASSRRPKLTIALWLAMIVALVAGGALVGTKSLSTSASGTGESATAYQRLSSAHLLPPAVESVLVRSADHAAAASAAAAVARATTKLPQVQSTHTLSRDGGRTMLVQVALRGDPSKADKHVAPVEHAVAAVAKRHPGTEIVEAGGGSIDHAITNTVNQDLQRAELYSLPVTLLILILAFGALVAASVPLLLGITSVAATLGAVGLISQIVPDGNSTAPVVVLIGLAVGVDYSLFYIRREREERRLGRRPGQALDVVAATVGRAIVIAGLTVMIALAGLLFTGLGVFTSMALGAIVVVAIAVIGSVTVLPATLTLLGDRIDKGRIFGRAASGIRGARRRRQRTTANAARRHRAWSTLAKAVTGHPRAALISSMCALGALAVPVLSIHTANPGDNDLPKGTPVLIAEHTIERLFPGAPATADLVVTGHHLNIATARSALRTLGNNAIATTRGSGPVSLKVASDGRTAVLAVPMPNRGYDAAAATIDALRQHVDPRAARIGPGARAQITGDAAFNVDFSTQMSTVTPLVIGFVLVLAFALLLGAFRSPALAASVIGLNLLSVGAAFGVLVAIFQHHWAQSLLGFTSDGAIVSWLPLFAFVVLFGLSMDYTVLMLERVREGRLKGADARTAAQDALTNTGSTVTSAAVVMVGVFAIFALLRLLEFKQLGVGLAAAIALDATIVRGVALPAALTLLGDKRGIRVPRAEPAAATPERGKASIIRRRSWF